MSQSASIFIDESVKVGSWGNHNIDAQHQFFKKYAAPSPPVQPAYAPPQQYQQYETQQIQVKTIQSGFRRLKNEQIQKLKDLKSEYQEIRKITTDYVPPKVSKTPSLVSSSHQSKPAYSPLTPKVGGRPKAESTSHVLQILELQKKQLQVMVENSMRKIEELLHNQMQYKKTIHELRLGKDNNSYDQGQGSSQQVAQYQRRQKELNQRIRVLQQDRQNAISASGSYKQRVKQLQSSLRISEQQLRRAVADKRNYEQTLRSQRDKYMSLEIQLKRQKRQHQIIIKDRNAQVSRLNKQIQLRGESISKQTRIIISKLQEQVRIKDQRYVLLFDKIQSQKRQQQKLDKENQIRLVNQMMSRSGNENTKAIQQTIFNIMHRLNDLQHKPIAELDRIGNRQNEQQLLENTKAKFQERILFLQKQVNRFESEHQTLQHQNEELKNQVIRLQKNVKRLEQEIGEQAGELQHYKKVNRTLKNNSSSANIGEIQGQGSAAYRDIQFKYQQIQQEKIVIVSQKQQLANQCRELRVKVSQLQFAVQKAVQQGEFNLQLCRKGQQVQSTELAKDLQRLRGIQAQLTTQNRQLRTTLQQSQRQFNIQSARLRQVIDQVTRQKLRIQQRFSRGQQVFTGKVDESHNLRVKQLTQVINSLTNKINTMQQQERATVHLVQENKVLKEYLHKMRYVNKECDRLWQEKENSYQAVNGLLENIRRN